MERRKTSLLPNKEAIIRKRVLAGMGKQDMAEKAGIHLSSVIRAELGQGVRPKAAMGICKALDAELDELFTIRS